MYTRDEEKRNHNRFSKKEKGPDLGEIKDFVKDHWKLLTLIMVVVIIIWVILQMAWANWLFTMKFNGWWMQNKAGVNIWDISFEKGYFWTAIWIIPLAWFLADPFFWRKRATMKIIYKLFDIDFEKSSFTGRFILGGIMAVFRTLIGFIVANITAHGFATQWLLVETYLQTHNMSWLEFIQRIYLSSINHYLFGGLPSGSYLIENTVVFDFLGMLFWLLVPILLYYTIVKLTAAVYTSIKEGNWVRVVRALVTIGFMWFIYLFILRIPTTVGDIAIPIHMWWRLATVVVVSAIILGLTLGERKMRPWIDEDTFKVGLTVISVGLLICIVVVAPFVGVWWNYSVQQNYSASKNIFEFPYKINPHIDYVKWTNDLQSIQTIPLESITTPPEFEENILKDIRVVSYVASIKQMIYSYGTSVGQSWMKLALEQEGDKYLFGPMIVWTDGHEYWVLPTSPVLPEQSDVVEGKRYVYTHSEVILAVDAATGEIVDFTKIFPQMNASALSMYYGIGGLFKEQDVVYLRIGNWNETHLSTYKGPESYDAVPDYVLSDKSNVFLGANERWWYFFWKGDIPFANGKYGDEISVLFKRDVIERVNSLLINGLELEKEPSTGRPIPYLVVDPQGNVYFAFAVNINRGIDNGYTDTMGYLVNTNGNFRRQFAILLVNTHDGTVKGYRYGNWNENYITRYFASFYGAWNNDLPDWLGEQLRYPKSLMYDLIDLQNTYRIDSNDWQSWYKTLNMHDFPVDKDWNYFDIKFDDIRYVPIYYEGKLRYAGIRIVELYKQKPESGQWSARRVEGIYMFLGTEGKFFVPLQNALAVQLILDSVNTNTEIQYILTTRKQQGQEWEAGNLMIYIINGKPIFFIPYYTMTATVMKVTMLVAIDGTTGDVGYYLLSANPTSEEIKVASSKAYTAMTKGILKSEQERIDKVKNELQRLGLTIRTPTIVNPMIAEQYATIDFKITQNWENVNATIQMFVQDICITNNIQTVYVWLETQGTAKVLSVGVLIQPSLTMEILSINIG